MAILKIRNKNGVMEDVPCLRGRDGKDYIITEDDKSEIAADVLNRMDVAGYAKNDDVNKAITAAITAYDADAAAYLDAAFALLGEDGVTE